MNHQRLGDLISLFERYGDFSVSNYNIAAKLFLQAAKAESDPAIQKILIVRIFSEMMASCENVARLVRVLHDRQTNPFENLLSSSEDFKYFRSENLERVSGEINAFGDDAPRFFKEYFLVEVFWDTKNADEQKVFTGILHGVRAAFANLLASPKGVSRALWNIHNKIKHGAPVMNKESRDSVVVYLSHDKPGDFPTTIQDGEKWAGTTEALRNTMLNLVSIVCDALKQMEQLLEQLPPKPPDLGKTPEHQGSESENTQ